MPPKWKPVRRELLQDCRVFTVSRQHAESPRSGDVHEFHRIDSSDWCNIVAVTPEDEVVMVTQYRHGSEEIELEIPGGYEERAVYLLSGAIEIEGETFSPGQMLVIRPGASPRVRATRASHLAIVGALARDSAPALTSPWQTAQSMSFAAWTSCENFTSGKSLKRGNRTA